MGLQPYLILRLLHRILIFYHINSIFSVNILLYSPTCLCHLPLPVYCTCIICSYMVQNFKSGNLDDHELRKILSSKIEKSD